MQINREAHETFVITSNLNAKHTKQTSNMRNDSFLLIRLILSFDSWGFAVLNRQIRGLD
jgi:hypothetical protein